ncbi:MAG: hypothetical protein JNK90_25865 [Planctomycetaceae bacterium]|nr:hypothetical protein [Planctomycetaceae bacterium]MBN8603840.1 hypothetical protein [Planctomycetota bacterium]
MSGVQFSHDLPGSIQRLTRMLNDLRTNITALNETWKDKKSQEFQTEHLLPIEPVITGAITSLSDLAELSGDIQKKLREAESML